MHEHTGRTHLIHSQLDFNAIHGETDVCSGSQHSHLQFCTLRSTGIYIALQRILATSATAASCSHVPHQLNFSDLSRLVTSWLEKGVNLNLAEPLLQHVMMLRRLWVHRINRKLSTACSCCTHIVLFYYLDSCLSEYFAQITGDFLCWETTGLFLTAAIFLGLFTHFKELGSFGGGEKLAFPRSVVIEPEQAGCLFQSARGGGGPIHGLACRAPSRAAWKILSCLTSDFMAVPDTLAVEGMREPATGATGDIPVVCGESSAASMGQMLGLDSDS